MFNLYQPTTATTIFVADADARFFLLENQVQGLGHGVACSIETFKTDFWGSLATIWWSTF